MYNLGNKNLQLTPFLKNQNWTYLWINNFKVWYSLFLLSTKLTAVEVYWDLVADHLLFPTKNLKDLWNNPWLILGMILKKNVSVVMFN